MWDNTYTASCGNGETVKLKRPIQETQQRTWGGTASSARRRQLEEEAQSVLAPARAGEVVSDGTASTRIRNGSMARTSKSSDRTERGITQDGPKWSTLKGLCERNPRETAKVKMLQEETVERKERKQDGSCFFLSNAFACMIIHSCSKNFIQWNGCKVSQFLPMKKMFFHFAFLGLQTFAAVFSVASGCEPLCSGLKVPLQRCLEGHLKAAFEGVGLKEIIDTLDPNRA